MPTIIKGSTIQRNGNHNMTPTFIITSAINTPVGTYSLHQRIFQTASTVQSIINHYPDALLVLIDGGLAWDQNDPMWQELKSRVNIFIEMWDHPQIQHLQGLFEKSPNRFEMGGTVGLTKSAAELTMMNAFLANVKTNPDLADVLKTDRIFKISGRYQLSPLFDKTVYESDTVKGKYVFKKADPSWMDKQSQEFIGTEFGYASRLWSFDINLIDDCTEKFEAMFHDCMEITQKHYIDIEHLLYKHIGPDNSVELQNIHLYGNIGPNGALVYD